MGLLERLARLVPFPIPYPHFMATAPLDVWIRMLYARGGVPHPRYWPRLGFAMLSSTLATVGTLIERLAMAPVLRFGARRSGTRLEHKPGVVVVLGYYRSGTTHLHYMLSCDPRFAVVRWCQALAPQAFAIGWTALRWLLVPFMSNQRPQDEMSFGPEWPAEEDFAVNNWTLASSLPSRMVFPSTHDHFSRYHSLDGLTESELNRWRFAMWAFLWKVTRLNRRKALLLKTPSSTARIPELLRLFGPENVRFIHISRAPPAVVRSNVKLHLRARMYHLEDPADEAEIERRVVEEYAATQRRYLETRSMIPEDRLAEVRFEDLVADPEGLIRSIYDTLGLERTERFERRLRTYLNSVRGYRPATAPTGPLNPGDIDPRLRFITDEFGHSAAAPGGPGQAAAEAPTPEAPAQPRERRAALAAIAAAAVCTALWTWFCVSVSNRYDWLVWPVGALIGIAAIHSAGRGTRRLGALAAALCLIALLAMSYPANMLLHPGEESRITLLRTYHGLFSWANVPWVYLGMFSAYRFASRAHFRPPGHG